MVTPSRQGRPAHLCGTAHQPTGFLLLVSTPVPTPPSPLPQVLVLFDGSGSQLSDLSGLMAPLVRHILLPVSRLLGFKEGYPSHRSVRPASSSSSTQQGPEASDSSSRDEL